MTQTAVKWLESMLHSMIDNGADLGEDYPAIMQHIQKAKEMEKEQIIKAVDSNFEYSNNGYPTLGQQYYYKTYNK